MHPLTLVTGKSESLVHRSKLIPFISQPDVIVWGSRLFKFLRFNALTGEYTYTEAFTHVVI